MSAGNRSGAPGRTARRIWSNLTALTMPVCPKCGKLISAKKYERHLKRCGTQHKRVRTPLVEHGASADVYWHRY